MANLDNIEILVRSEVEKQVKEALASFAPVEQSAEIVTHGASAKTDLGLNQWLPEDVPIMDDFNEDNRIIQEAFDTLNADLADRIYPVGAIYMSVNSTDPAELFGGSWVAWGGGRVPVGIGSNGTTNYQNVEAIGGAETHVLTAAQMPSHTHTQNSHNHTQNAHTHTQNAHSHSTQPAGNDSARFVHTRSGLNANFARGIEIGLNFTEFSTTANATATNQNATAVNQATTATNQNTGGGGAHSSMQPWITCFMWKRIS